MVNQKLRHLSELPETDFPFISLYLCVNAHEFLEQKEKDRIFIKNFIQDAEKKIKEEKNREKLESFKKDIKKIKDFLENKVNSKARGVAIFACDKLGIFKTFFSVMPFENACAINSIPHLKQLAYHFDECENALLVMLDKQTSRIFNVKLGGFILDEMDMEHEVHRFHKQGGWAQMRYQRYIENQVHQHFKEVAKVTEKMLDNNRYESIILAGQHHEIMNFQKLLPKRVNLKIIEVNALDMKENINHILEKVIDDLQFHEFQKEICAVQEVIETTPVRSTLGMQDTIKLVEEGRAETIVIPGYKTYQGWKCNGCLYVKKDQRQAGCPECNHHSRETDLIEEIIRLAIKNRGNVELVKDKAAEKLEKFEGIGALIRY